MCVKKEDPEGWDSDKGFASKLSGDQYSRNKYLVIDIEGFEGPLHLLLELARQQKVDLFKISVLQLAQQYLKFIEKAKQIELELATDYLVMASWLAYLKSRLLLPVVKPEEQREDADKITQEIAFRLKKLEVMREAGQKLMARHQWKVDVFGSGQAERIQSITIAKYDTSLYELLKTYGQICSRSVLKNIEVPSPRVLTLENARSCLESVIRKKAENWTSFREVLEEVKSNYSNLPKKSLCASSFASGLELVKEQKALLRQQDSFEPLYIKSRNITKKS